MLRSISRRWYLVPFQELRISSYRRRCMLPIRYSAITTAIYPFRAPMSCMPSTQHAVRRIMRWILTICSISLMYCYGTFPRCARHYAGKSIGYLSMSFRIQTPHSTYWFASWQRINSSFLPLAMTRKVSIRFEALTCKTSLGLHVSSRGQKFSNWKTTTALRNIL